jgi:hypothetical protein
MSLSPPTSTVAPVAGKPARRSDGRFLIVWTILLAGLVIGAAASTTLSLGQWFALMMFVYFVPFKIAALIALTPEERRQWTWRRLVAFFLWIGLQPRPFLRGYALSGTEPRPTWRGFLLNVLTGAVLVWGVAWLLPEGTPPLVRAWIGLIGVAWMRLFGGFDLWALIFRLMGFPVEKVFVNPLSATSLRDFWGRRWNRIMSGMMRDLLFTPLARRVGVIAATVVVFVYSGVVHEFVSVLAQSGYGRPTLYFLIQGAGFLMEGTRFGRRYLASRPIIGRCWTALVVIVPVALVVPPVFLEQVIVPVLREMRVPGLSEG